MSGSGKSLLVAQTKYYHTLDALNRLKEKCKGLEDNMDEAQGEITWLKRELVDVREQLETKGHTVQYLAIRLGESQDALEAANSFRHARSPMARRVAIKRRRVASRHPTPATRRRIRSPTTSPSSSSQSTSVPSPQRVPSPTTTPSSSSRSGSTPSPQRSRSPTTSSAPSSRSSGTPSPQPLSPEANVPMDTSDIIPRAASTPVTGALIQSSTTPRSAPRLSPRRELFPERGQGRDLNSYLRAHFEQVSIERSPSPKPGPSRRLFSPTSPATPDHRPSSSFDPATVDSSKSPEYRPENESDDWDLAGLANFDDYPPVSPPMRPSYDPNQPMPSFESDSDDSVIFLMEVQRK